MQFLRYIISRRCFTSYFVLSSMLFTMNNYLDLVFLLSSTHMFCSKVFPLPRGTLDRLCYFIVALPGPVI